MLTQELEIGFFDSIDAILKAIETGDYQELCSLSGKNHQYLNPQVHSRSEERLKTLQIAMEHIIRGEATKLNGYDDSGAHFYVREDSDGSARFLIVEEDAELFAAVLKGVHKNVQQLKAAYQSFKLATIIIQLGEFDETRSTSEEAVVFDLSNIGGLDLTDFWSFIVSQYQYAVKDRDGYPVRIVPSDHELMNMSIDDVFDDISKGSWIYHIDDSQWVCCPPDFIKQAFVFEVAFNPFQSFGSDFGSDNSFSGGPAVQ